MLYEALPKPFTSIMPPATVVAIVGAESTGKTTLTQALTKHLHQLGHEVMLVPEYLRIFCNQHQRTPHQHEQLGIAHQQSLAIENAMKHHPWVVADSTALMTAVYSDLAFTDRSLYPTAIQSHAKVSITLLTALDLPWVADGYQRDGSHVREPVDTLLRKALTQAELPFSMVSGQGEERLKQAWSSIEHYMQTKADPNLQRVTWRWICERCDDGACEQHSLRSG